MFGRVVPCFVVFGFALACAPGSSPTPNRDAEPAGISDEAASKAAKAFVASWVAGDFEAAAATLAPPIASRQTPAELEKRWNAMTRAYGGFGEVPELEIGAQYGMAVASGVLPMERAQVSVKVVVDDEGRVDDFYFDARP